MFVATLSSHPHIFIEYIVEPVFSATGLEGLQLEWTFDEMFSWQIVMDYTDDHDYNISEAENKVIEKEAFSYLQESGYFADFYVDGKKKIVKTVTDFRAEGRDESIIYHFFIPWKIIAKKEATHVAQKIAEANANDLIIMDKSFAERMTTEEKKAAREAIDEILNENITNDDIAINETKVVDIISKKVA